MTICVLFTIITRFDIIAILLGLWPPKEDLGPYVHLLGRFVLISILVGGLQIFDILASRIKSKLVIYAVTFFLTWGILLVYLWIQGLFTELHPDAYIDISISYAFMYGLLGIVVFVFGRTKKAAKNKKITDANAETKGLNIETGHRQP